jgi:hypothetical protein
LNGHCLIVDFSPVIAGFSFDLKESCSVQLWPVRQPAGVRDFKFDGPARVDRVLRALCQAITVRVHTAAPRA